MLIKYFVENTEFASRTRDLIPRKGDLIRIVDILYVIEVVVWVEDMGQTFVSIDLVKE